MSLSYAWWKKYVINNFRAFFIIFNHANACASMCLLVKIHNRQTSSIFPPKKLSIYLAMQLSKWSIDLTEMRQKENMLSHSKFWLYDQLEVRTFRYINVTWQQAILKESSDKLAPLMGLLCNILLALVLVYLF